MSVRTRRKAPDAARNGASEHAAQVAKREVAQCRAQSRLAVDHGKGSRRAACTHCSEMNLRRAEAAHKARQPLVSALESHAELPPCHPTLQAQIAPATPNAARAPREGLLVSRRRAAYFVQTPARRSGTPCSKSSTGVSVFATSSTTRSRTLLAFSSPSTRGRLSLCGGARGS
jgi:hypothetical protein